MMPTPPRPLPAPTVTPPAGADAIRVMVVDDSVVIRGLVGRLLQGEPSIRIVGSVGNGRRAIEQLRSQPADVIILDIDMPEMDGLTALPKLLEIDPAVRVIMASTLTTRNAEISFRALRLGATDYVPKPSTVADLTGGISAETFRTDLLAKVLTLGRQRRRAAGGPALRPAAAAATASVGAAGTARAASASPAGGSGRSPIVLRERKPHRPQVLTIASSTGGPQALFALCTALGTNLGLPILITQHMPPMFTAILAEHLARAAGWPASEGKNGEAIEPNRIYIAPGGFHMVVDGDARARRLRITEDPPENFCRPSADPLFRSVAAHYRDGALAIVLTGIGADGRQGADAIVAAGGTVIAQDEASSVVWGMPGAVAKAGLASALLPPADLAGFVKQALRA